MENVLIISSVLLWIVCLFTLFLTLALVRLINGRAKEANASASLAQLEVGQQAPEFSAQTLDGDLVTRSTYAGRKAAFLFVSPDCGPCRDLLPKIVPLIPGAKEAGVDLVLVSDDEEQQTRTFAEEFDIHFPVLIAPFKENPFMKAYKSTSTPSYCLLDEQGIVLSAGRPSMEWGEWKKLVHSWTKDTVLASSKKGGA